MRIHIANRATSSLKVFGKEVYRGTVDRFKVKNNGVVNIYSDTGRCTIRISSPTSYSAKCKGDMNVHLTYNKKCGYFFAKVTD